MMDSVEMDVLSEKKLATCQRKYKDSLISVDNT